MCRRDRAIRVEVWRRMCENWEYAFLKLKETSVHIEVSSFSPSSTCLTLGLSQKELEPLLLALEDSLLQGGGELRLALPSEWVLFFKERGEGSRALVAHPQKDEWVGTIALEPDFSKCLLSTLRGLHPGQKAVLSQIGVLNSVSNLEWVISLEN